MEKIEVQSLKIASMQRLQEHILSGKFEIGQRLPSERDLAKTMGISRPVLHEAIVALDAQGLVEIKPRRGVFVRDYRRDSSMALLHVLLGYESGDFNPELFQSLIEARLLIERETAKLASNNISEEQKDSLLAVVQEGIQIAPNDIDALVDYDFTFHLEIALASGNQMYPMFLNSLKGVHANLARKFFTFVAKTEMLSEVFDLHDHLCDAIIEGKADRAELLMTKLLRHGENQLAAILKEE